MKNLRYSIAKRRLYIIPLKDSKVKQFKSCMETGKTGTVIKMENEQESVWTTAKTVEEFLKEQSIVLNEHDEVQPSLRY